MIITENMRQIDTSTLVTLKQRIERELMRRGDVEQDDTPAPERMTKAEWTELYLRGELTVDVPAGHITVPGHYRIGGLQRVGDESNAMFSVLPEEVPMNTTTPLAKRRLLREPDPGCPGCGGKGVWLGTSHTNPLTQLCPCLWGGE